MNDQQWEIADMIFRKIANGIGKAFEIFMWIVIFLSIFVSGSYDAWIR